MSKEEYISKFVYEGKTINEWEEEVEKVEGLDEERKPKWWKPQANATYGRVFAKMFYENQNEDE